MFAGICIILIWFTQAPLWLKIALTVIAGLYLVFRLAYALGKAMADA